MCQEPQERYKPGPPRSVCLYTLAGVLGEEILLSKEQGEGAEVSSFLTRESVLLQLSSGTLIQQYDPRWQKP